MTDEVRPARRPKLPPEQMFERLFARTAENSALDQDLREADRFWRDLGKFQPPEEVSRYRSGSPWWSMAAACAACFLLIATWGVTFGFVDAAQPPVQHWRSFATRHAQQATVMLEDGSNVSLAANSRIEVNFTAARRDLRLLSGQALFEVAKDHRRPFVVTAGPGTVTAVGTVFNVRLRPRETELTVVEGVVDVGMLRSRSSSAAATVARAIKGEQVNFGIRDRRGSPVAFVNRETVDPASIASWTHGKLYFHGEALAEVVAIVNNYAPRPLVLKNTRLADMPVYGLVNQGDVSALKVLVGDEAALGYAGE